MIKNNYNIGICILRIWFSFEVVLCHYWVYDTTMSNKLLKIFANARSYAVPVFMLLSFILTENIIENGRKVKSRLFRLLFPYVAWPILYSIIFGILDILLGSKMMISPRDLYWQLLFGHSPKLNPPLWYQFNLIILTLFFIFLFKYIKKYISIVICTIFVLALFIQYSNINSSLFANYRYEITYPLGRIAEMIPYACIGILISKYNLLLALRNKYKSSIYIYMLII